ncbi:MAG: DNA-directed RNA polymerase subunit beta [Candidatus Colwellbacteria bacterium]|nr:DNA-directed RNA polymerase subunit beta [Candidatus Colwellbacteria bacterium]
MPKIAIKNFSSHPGSFVKQSDLALIQIRSYEWFRDKALKELFKEFSPIKDYSDKKFELHFLDYSFDEPKYTEEESRFKGITYEASLRAKVKLINKEATAKRDKEKEQEVYLGDFPVMTKRGTFIINGVERVVISQLVRSPGAYFTEDFVRGKRQFAAKIIPARGAWLEFETDSNGAIGVKIDRHRKVAASILLRVFGLNREEIEKAVGPGIEATLAEDEIKEPSEAYLEIYRRIRPGDLAGAEDAKKLIDAMFFQQDRYDLSAVGRFKLNQRLKLDPKIKNRLLEAGDLVAVLREIIRLNNDPRAEEDDIDHLGNRRVRSVGELLELRLRVGFTRLRRTIQDRMSTIEAEDLTPAQLINPRLLVAVVREFFASSQLSQFLQQVNPLDELEHKRRLTALGPGGLTRERAGMEVRDVHSSYYSRICPIQTPEGQNIGLVNHLSSFAEVNEYGFIIAPYLKVQKGKLTNEVVWLDAKEEENYRIAEANTPFDKRGMIVGERVGARIAGEPGTAAPKEIDLIDVASYQLVSVATSLVPFLEHTDATRALMASNMQRQAVPSVKPEAPLVSTGVEEKLARDSGRLAIAPAEGEIAEADATRILMKTTAGKKYEFPLDKFKMSNQYMAITHRPLVKKGDKVKSGQVLADGQSTDSGILALGQNLLVAFMPWEGANFEDAIILSERVQRDGLYNSIHIEEYSVDVRDTKLGVELTTPDIPNISEDKLRNLDEEGIIRIGAEVRGGDILVGKISPKGESELTPEERLLRAVFGEKARDVKDTSLELPYGKYGRVVGVKIFSRERGDKLDPGVISRIYIEIATMRNIQAGDKMAGRHGNKGVVSQVRPVEDMPHLEDGTPVDIILNPLGVISRMNLGQIFEAHLGWAASRLGYRAVTPVFAGATEAEIRAELRAADLPEEGRVILYDGRTGKPFDRKVAVGVIYMMKLNHLVADKIHMRSIGPYSLITQQPLGGKAQLGGQRFGEMEVWALEGYGAVHTLQEMLTTKSDDVVGRSAVYEAIVRGEKIKRQQLPAAFNVMVSELKALGLNVLPLRSDRKQNEEISDE